MDPKDNEEPTEYCFNCRRNIPLGNHVMHSAYCHRNLKLCFKCDEPFLTSEFEKHQETMHADILCEDCSEKLEAIDLESHKLNNCPQRLQTCNFCEIDMKASLLPAHSDTCSSRTEHCDDCGQFIMLKYLALHKESHKLKKIPNIAKPVLDDSPESLAAYPPLTKKVPNATVDGTARGTTRTTSMPSLRLHEPLMTNHRVSPPAKRNNDQPQINMLNNNDNSHKDPKKNMPIADTPSDDDDDCSVLGAHSIHNQSSNINNYLRNEYNNFTDVLKGVQLPCEFCQKMINSENLVLHETGCRPDLAAFHNILHTKNKNTNNLNDKYPIPPLDLDSSSDDSEINLNILSLSSDDDDDDSEKTNVEKLPCEFCEELISIKKLISHQIKCEKIHLNLPVVNNLDKKFNTRQSNISNTKFSKSGKNCEHIHNLLLKQKSAPANLSKRTLVLRNRDSSDTRLPSISMTHMLPRVKLNKLSSNQGVDVPADNRYVNNSARNNYEQFLSNSRSNHFEQQTFTRDNSHLYLNPSGGAIPKRKNSKSKNNQRVINNLSKRRDSESSSD